MVCTTILLKLLELTFVNHLLFVPHWPNNTKNVTSFSVIDYVSCHSDIWYSSLYLDESGSRHKQMLDGRCSNQSQCRVKMTSSPRPTCRIKHRMGSKPRAVVGVSGRPFHCEMCQVSVNSETQLKQVCGFISI